MKDFYVYVGVEMGDGSNEYDWYKVKADNAGEAEDKVCEWQENHLPYWNYCWIEEVREEEPKLYIQNVDEE